MRIAVLDRNLCQPRKCSKECFKYCPKVRTGDETIIFDEDDRPIISEILCVGCGICIKKCPAEAIKIVNLPEKLKTQEVHRFGENGFALFGLPIPHKGSVVGILGSNGIGKSTSIKILTGNLRPNLGKKEGVNKKELLKYFAGSELQNYFKNLIEGKIRCSHKIQNIDLFQKFYGKVSSFLKKESERSDEDIEKIVELLDLKSAYNRNVSDLSGGELQRVAIAVSLLKDVDFYFFDEVTPFLDIFQRIKIANIIQMLSQSNNVLIVEHDLAILDLLTDTIQIIYGEPGVYGITTKPIGSRSAINQYIDGYLKNENIRIRDKSIRFEVRAPRSNVELEILKKFDQIYKRYEGFSLEVTPGEFRKGEIIGGVGPNAIGKSTFAKLFAGVIKPTEGELDFGLKVSYKPQYVKGDSDTLVSDVLSTYTLDNQFYEMYLKPLRLDLLMNKKLSVLSGGELQRVAIVLCLIRDADMYILDEPSAHLDVEERIQISKIIRRSIEDRKATALVIDHDIYLIDLVSDRLLVFLGNPGIKGKTSGPLEMKDGMNLFLKMLGITFRRDEETKRPRINKLNSRLDREQKERGEYYYA
ncbi:MAG: ribosome biogenesis/translation initiation ATPase RLI [Candidatus Methanoliparum thermophilum]|uniref:Ribosome biogenesis/translation initiation ATPase RLI n=1 Tax=Methanoliparum thermophilum TaxID=2491083 RepID=A0A520KQP3_METT2|nr:ribosome biogenesis/translation initiation ATPase RLI [Candidatus Methanoliparum sp. LAM-1]RZN63836.1 MAG: ribosome biogenesis/translation initiation ATPase RLI [Candidatus Methanoliparum thermophilum]BDC36440.1 ribosome biogenesis/translation initiation ATPase RLI [Candidatus Methanoliparum sp. LAM-1]